jgi:ferritin-like metal-binding protein YciE
MENNKTIIMAKSATAKKSASKKAAPRRTSPAKGTASRSSSEESMPSSGGSGREPALTELFIDSLKDIYWAEKQLVKTLPKMQKAATSQQLKDAFGTHLEQTRGQVARLEQVFEMMGKKAQAKKCDAMEGLTKEGESIIEETDKGSATRDVGLILAAQKVEHYEIATYGGLAQLAKTIGQEEVSELLGQTLAEEKETDELLTDIAENDINYEASEEE